MSRGAQRVVRECGVLTRLASGVVCCKNEAAPGTEHIEGLRIVRADLRVRIFDGFDQLTAVLAAEFHTKYFTAANRPHGAWGSA